MLEPYGINTTVVPVGGGWHYLQEMPDGSKHRIPTQFVLPSDAALIKAVVQFRANHNLPQGDVMADIADYVRKISPENDRFRRNPHLRPKAKPLDPRATLSHRITDWLRNECPRQPRLIPTHEADERSEICAKCPQNVQWKTLCYPCNEITEAFGQNLRQRPGYKFDSQLKACRLHSLYLPAAVFVDRDALPPVNGDAPSACWLHPHASPHLSQDPPLPAVPAPEGGG